MTDASAVGITMIQSMAGRNNHSTQADNDMTEKPKSLSHFLLGTWLIGFFLAASIQVLGFVFELIGLRSVLGNGYVEFFGIVWPSNIVLVSLIGLPLLARSSRPLTVHLTIKLTVYAGFFVLLSTYVLGLSSLLSSSHEVSIEYGLDRIGAWLAHPDGVRLITYIGLGYLVARHRGFRLSLTTSAIVAFSDITLGLLVPILSLPASVRDEVMPLILSEVWWLEAVRDMTIDASILIALGAIGALLTWVRWPQIPFPFLRRKPRRYRPARRITSRSGVSQQT